MSTIKEIINAFSVRFNPAAAGDMNAVFQFSIDNELYYLTVAAGICKIAEGQHTDPNVTLTMSLQTLEEMMSGTLTGVSAFMMGKLKTDGDMMLATKLNALFGLG
jgi:putative sterol carrier protein